MGLGQGENAIASSGMTPIVITAVADGLWRWFPSIPVNLVRVGVVVTTALANETGVVTFDKRPTPSSDTGRTVIATITHTAAVPAGTHFYVNLNPSLAANQLNPGQELIFGVTNLWASGGLVALVEYRPMPFVAGPDSRLPTSFQKAS